MLMLMLMLWCFDVNFDLTDLAEDNLHPGPIAHKEYAEKIKNVLQDRFK